MNPVKSLPLIRKIKDANEAWFSSGNKRLFGDISYQGYYGKKSGNPYLVRSTYAWTDMFGQPKKLHYRINRINSETYDIEPLIDTIFNDIYEVKNWLKDN